MCFSAEASFVSSALLGGIGLLNVLTLKLRKGLILLALIPFFFGIQQFTEGLIWLHLTHEDANTLFFKYIPYVYLTFAFLVWPVYFPLSLLLAEVVPWRRKVLWTVLIMGLTLVTYYILAPKGNLELKVHDQSIRYSFLSPGHSYVYLMAGVLSIFFSSVKHVWIFGVLLALSFILADYFYEQTFVSVWCFLVAISSVCLYFILKQNQLPKANSLELL